MEGNKRILYIVAEQFRDEEVLEPLLELVRSFVDAGKGIGAICWAPTILAKLGLLDGHEVAVCHIPDAGEYDGLQSHEVVQQAGARIASQGVARSGLFITGSGPRAAAAFAHKLLEYLDELPDTAL